MNQKIVSFFYHDDDGKKVVITLDDPIDIPDECHLRKADGTYDDDLELSIENIEYMLDGLIDHSKQWPDYIKSCREAVSKHPDVTLDMVDWCAYASEVGMKLIKHEFMLAFKIMSKCNHSVDGKPGLLDKYSGCIKEMVYIISGCIKEMDDIISEINGIDQSDGESH